MQNNYFNRVYCYDSETTTPLTPASVGSTNNNTNLFDFTTIAALLSPLTINNNANYLTINDIDTSTVWSPSSQPATYISPFFDYESTRVHRQKQQQQQIKFNRAIIKTGSKFQSKDELGVSSSASSSSQVFKNMSCDKTSGGCSKMLPKRSENFDFSDLISKAMQTNGNKRMSCNFCRNNNETQEIYTSHPLKDSLGRIVCPILKAYACPRCGATGDYSHTLKYCPIVQKKSKLQKIKKFSMAKF